MRYTVKNRTLAKLIISMANDDQRARRAALKDFSFCTEMINIDQKNIRIFKKIVNRFGWPTISLVGKRASHAAWLLAQHADSDREFQEHCLKLLILAEKNGDVRRQEVAFLTDRVLINNGRPQLYGTQFYVGKHAKIIPRPIRNRHSLEQRRAAMELGNFADYQREMERSTTSSVRSSRLNGASAILPRA